MIGVEAARVAQLVASFEAVDRRMADLPVYNRALTVEAVGFRALEYGLLGIVITPWFLSVLLLPVEAPERSAWTPGAKIPLTLPAGSFEFIAAHDTVCGDYAACSLFSPVFEFDSQAVARLVAEAAMDVLFRPGAAAGDAGAEGAEPTPIRSPSGLGRRGLVGGPPAATAVAG